MSGDLIAEVFAAQGFWVARCPRPYCFGAEHYGPRRSGALLELGNLTETGMRCKECGGTFAAVWPADRVEIERILMERPDPFNRNWLPGETLHDLLGENITHGIFPAASIAAANRDLRDVTGQRPEAHELTDADLTSLLFPGRSVLALEGGC
jgi:hypothetical protein